MRYRVSSKKEEADHGGSAKPEITAIEPREYTRAEWWRSETGLIAFQNEIMKYLYYRLKY